MPSHYREGKSIADALSEAPNISLVPEEFKAENAPEASLSWVALHEATQKRAATSEASTILHETQKSRASFRLDPNTDPLLKASAHINQNAEAFVERESESGTPSVASYEVVCQEPGEPLLRQTVRTLVVRVAQKRKIFLHSVMTKRFLGRVLWTRRVPQELAPRRVLRHRLEYEQTPVYRYERVFPGQPPEEITAEEYEQKELGPKEVQEEWVWDSTSLEKDVEAGKAVHVSVQCTQEGGVRVIDGHPIKRACWQETVRYACQNTNVDTCRPLREKGCFQIKQRCLEEQGGRCLKFEKVYQCGGPASNIVKSKKRVPFCLDGNCDERLHSSSEGFAEAMTQLSIFKEMGQQMDPVTLSVFKGEDNRCSRNCIDFKDCCGSGKGWGTNLGLAHCSAGEKALFEKRRRGLCVEVGEYCARRRLGVCVSKRKTFVCFPTKMARLIQQQARAQLGLGWGSPQNPLTRGLTTAEIQRVDFSKIDLRELFQNVAPKAVDMEKLACEMKSKIDGKMKG